MAEEKAVRDIMTDIFEFPHVPYWFTVRQVSGILKKALGGAKCLRPAAALVFDEKYNLLGHIEMDDILAGFSGAALPSLEKSGASLASPDELCLAALKDYSEKPVSSLLRQFSLFAAPEESLPKAAELLLKNRLSLLPVLENQKKLLGVIRSTDVFDYLASRYFMA